MPKPKRNTDDWRNLPYEYWNVRTLHAYFADRNRELYGVDPYLPMRNWRFEQGVLKRALTEYGAETLHRAFDVIFREYRPSRDYPYLTAGFAVAYRLNAVLPRILAEKERKNDAGETDYNELKGWL
ncbi:hypothetical protein PACILC2_34640 [Paenibacillus cisolokensis]|uniref:Uncharacterized protein n=1 Tax=Paenibacillus cisolokensis TaxID=1658519 RepID=A0ABQ4N9M8_9BACL|nr:hypothetical protein [Paenibacillus cisolokensis]GIQ64896.1 hypothetical protein PACILC2_34640 [Paenibacillus cisolokensis]